MPKNTALTMMTDEEIEVEIGYRLPAHSAKLLRQLIERQASPEPSRGMIGMGAQALASELALAVGQDDAAPDGHDMAAGLFGRNVSAWLRKVSSEYLSKPATSESEGERCAQCKKAYKQGATGVGCPKCAPGERVSEAEFQQPISKPELTEDAYHVKLLIEAIGNAAQKVGIYNGQVPLTGPLALMLVGDMATCAATAQRERP